MIQLRQISLQRGTKELLKHVDLDIFPGHKIAVIGPNGCGKSSLFGLLRGQLQPDDGELSIPKQWRMVAVEQQILDVNRPAIEYVIDGDKKLRELQSQSEKLDGDKLAHVLEQLELAGAYDVQSRAAAILNGLGFSEDKHHAKVSEFSGGWQMRLNLARALLCPSDILLLDEPTNHLDLDAVMWLEAWLQSYPGTLLLISHDQSFIDSTAKQILSFENKTLQAYTGGYSSYEKQKLEKLNLAAAEYDKQQKKRAHLESFITRFKAKASKAKQAQSRVKQLEKMQELMPVRQQSAFSFEFPEPDKLPNPIVYMENVAVGYGDVEILHDIKLNLVPGSRIGLLGRNGAGKSTLIKLMSSKLTPSRGEYTASAGLILGYFAQHQVDSLEMQETPLWHIQRLNRQATEQSIRDYLGGFGFHGDEAVSIVKPMSGGEKARLVLAILVYQKPNLLLLDEPTNHLDIEVRQALTYALQTYHGAIVVVSHDRALLEAVCDDYYLVHNGEVKPFNGDLQDYRQYMLQADKLASEHASQSDSKIAVADDRKLDRKEVKRLEAQFRQQTKSLRDAIKKAESKMNNAQSALDEIEQKLLDETIYSAENKPALTELLEKRGEWQSMLEDAEMEWMEASESLEQAQQALDSQIQ